MKRLKINNTSPYLLICKLSVFRSRAGVVTFELVFGFFQQGVHTVFEKSLVVARAAVFHEYLYSHGTQALLHVRVPTARHLLWDLKRKNVYETIQTG